MGHWSVTIQLRIPAPCDAPALSDLVIRNRDHFSSGEPLRSANYYSVENQELVIGKALQAGKAGSGYMFLIEEDGVLVGRASLNSVIRGAFQSASVSYAVDASNGGRGIATRALRTLTNIGFGDLGLHRLQGETLIENRASQKVRERCGFRWYGTAPNYLRVHGQWRDHHLYQLINDAWAE